ncbi:hypothetical protein [Larkinella humicola]|uniref:Uncharacterized protein n=1 Tax=Larkinella humicola TaxID=2607654 RepID=A0A5N1JSS1_9BACT|nr:hypothetical protein [Larkinella humicola]KAA9357362.1 hypothetical protein F0P93_06395 [Larkinella humicola]
MKPLHCLLLLTAFACQSKKNTDHDQADAYRDLLIDRVIWKKSDVANPPGSPTNVHGFTMTNTSELYSYHQIEVRFDYFDSTYHKIGSSNRILPQAIGPRAALPVRDIQDGPVMPAARSATVTVVKAESDRAVLPE